MTSSKLNYFVARGETLTLNQEARASLRGSYAQLSDGVTHYELSGPAGGELVLLVPGMTIPLFYWDDFANELHGLGFRTLAYSAYGRGYSDRVVATYNRDFFVRQAKELLFYLNAAPVSHVIGTSMGALISMALLQEKWFSTKTLTLTGPAGLASQPPLAARIAKLNGIGVLFGRYLGQRNILSHLDHNVRTRAHAMRLKAIVGDAFRYEGSIYALFSTLRSFPLANQQDLYLQTERLGIPTLLAWGAEDQITPIAGMESVKAMLKPVQSHSIEECGHMAPFECPGKIAKLFANFISN